MANNLLQSFKVCRTKTLQICSFLKYSQMKGLVLGVFTEKSQGGNKISEYTEAFKDVDKKCGGKLAGLLKETGPFVKTVKQKTLWVPLMKEAKIDLGFDCVSVVDLGAKEIKDNPNEGVNAVAERVRVSIATGVKALQSCSDFEVIYLDPCDNACSAGEASHLTVFIYNELKDQSCQRPKIKFHLYEYDQISNESIAEYEKGCMLAESQNFVRHLVETPANFMTPTIFASRLTEKFKDTAVKVFVRDEAWAQSKKMGSFLSVSRGSEEPPKFVELHYDGAPASDKCIALVGKGITFDSGGISLKPGSNMDKMRGDMGGAGCVAGTILAASLLKLKVNVKGFMALSENLPSGKATKPGDVVRAMNGKTIQVDNTDAEGRLVLADALCYAQEFKPLCVVDLATLTGGVRIALGSGASGVYSNDENLWNILSKAGYHTGDRVWRLPLFECYRKTIKNPILADLNNQSSMLGQGSSCTAAAFLSEFVNSGTKWMHLDIAGVSESKDDFPYCAKGMSGRPTRTMVHFLKDMEDNFQAK